MTPAPRTAVRWLGPVAPGLVPALAALVLAALVLAAPAVAQDPPPAGNDDARPLPEPALRVELSPKEVTIGDRVRATLILEWPAGAPDASPRFPAWQQSWGNAEVITVGEVERTRGTEDRTLFTQTIELAAFDTGDVDLRPVTIAIPVADQTLEVKTPDDLRFTVVSVLPELAEGDELPEARPAADLIALPSGTRFVWTAAALGVLCLLTALAVARRTPVAGVTRRVAPRLPPLEELLMQLGGVSPGVTSERAHTTLSLALRTYLGRATGVQAAERTTTEIQRQLRRGDLDPGLAQRVVTLLHQCDEAKFVPGIDVESPQIAARKRETKAIAEEIHEGQKRIDEAARAAAEASRQGPAATDGSRSTTPGAGA